MSFWEEERDKDKGVTEVEEEEDVDRVVNESVEGIDAAADNVGKS